MAVNSVLPLQLFASVLPGWSSCCPSRLSLLPQDGDLNPRCFIGARRRVRGLGGAELLHQGFQPAPDPECFGDTGASLERGAHPGLRVPAPEPPVPPAHSTGAPFAGHPLVATALCVPGHSQPHGTGTALPELTSLPTSTTAEPCSGAQQVKYLPGCWFCSWYCCSSGAEERVGGDFCIATAAAA